MLDHLIIATDPYFGQDILPKRRRGAQLVAEGFNELWQETLNGNLYGAMCKVGQFFALATLTLYIVELGKNFINQEDMKALSSWIWPIIVIGLLANNGTLLRSGTLTVRGYINNVNNDVLNFTAAGANLEVAFNRAVGNIALQQQVGGAMERCRSIPGGTGDAIACLQQAELEIKKSAPGLFKGEAPSEGSWEFNPLKSLSDAKDALSNLSPGQVIEKVGNTITSTIGSMITGFVAVILLALNNAYQWGIEFTMLLTALLGQLAVGGSLLPFGAKPIFAWLTGYFSVGIAKLCFNIIIGLCGQLIANSEQNQPMIFLLFVGLVSPILASSLTAGGGLAVWSGLGKAASFGSQVAAPIATAGASTAATVGVNATKFVAAKVRKNNQQCSNLNQITTASPTQLRTIYISTSRNRNYSRRFSGILSLLLQFINFGATSANNRYMKAMTFVQLENGSTKTIKSVAPGERTDKVINDFVTNSLIKLFNWDGVINEDDNGNLVQKVDKGIEIETVNGARRKIPTDVWEGAFTLSENQDFRASFLKKLAETIPEGILSGKGTVTLVTNFVSKPRKIEHGKWEVDVIGNLVTFNGERNLSKGITFNKTITVAAIDSPQNPPETSEIAKKIYKAKMSGLEITQIVDYELGKKRK